MPEPYQNDFSAAPPPLASNGLTDNVAGGLAYITIFPALLFLFLPPYNRRPFVRFQCCQCLFLFLASAASNILHIIPSARHHRHPAALTSSSSSSGSSP